MNERTLYDCKSVYEYYKMIKYYHQFIDYDINIIGSDERIEIYKFLIQQLSRSSMLDFTFVKSYLTQCRYFYSVHTDSLEFFVISKSNLSKKDKSTICNTISRIKTIIKLYNMINKTFRFFIVMNPMKRHLPESGILKTIHINGGFTYTNDRDIFIIRKEDYQKVILHELLHHNNLIHNENWKLSNIIKLKTFFNIHPSYQLIPNEAVVETIACILHVCFTAIERKALLSNVYTLEKNHSRNIVKKILQFQNIGLWYEETNAYAYTVLKNILFCNFNGFMKIFNFKYYDDSIITNFIINNHKKYKKLPKKDIKDMSLKLTLL